MQSGSAGAWTVGQFACKDDTNASYVVNNMSVPCNAGESIGVAAGDPSGTTNMHLVDLIPEASVQGGTMLTFFCSSGVTAGATMYLFPGALNPACALATAGGEMQPVSFSGTIKNLVVFYATPPGAGMHRTDTFTVYKCPGLTLCAATTVKCQVTTGATTPSTCSDLTDSVAVAQGDGIQIVDVADTSSAAANPRVTIQIQ